MPNSPPAALGGRPPADLTQAASKTWTRQIAETVNEMQRGKMNCTGSVTLAANAATTTLIDPRISAFSMILFMPTTADAAAEIGNGTLYVSAQQSGQATLTHANNAEADRTFGYAVIG